MADQTLMFTEQYRPYHLDEMIGQPRAVESVGAWLRTGRVPRAILISGEMSSGKTTSARIIARAVLCKKNQAGKACGECSSCKEFDHKSHSDYFEMNAASDRGIDAMRSMAERLPLMPLMGTKRVVVCDEAHMVTKPAFQAILKVLEEPPPHVVFMVVTAVPGAIDPMVISRLSPLKLQSVTVKDCTNLLLRISKDLKLETKGVTEEHLARIARVVHAHPRNALHVLDQVYTMVLDAENSSRDLDAAIVNGFINQVSNAGIEAIAAAVVRSVLEGKPASAMARAEDNRAEAEGLLTGILALSRQAMLLATSPKLMDPYYKEVLEGLPAFSPAIEDPQALKAFKDQLKEPVLKVYETFVDLRMRTAQFGTPVAEVMDAFIARAAMVMKNFLAAHLPKAPARPVALEPAKSADAPLKEDVKEEPPPKPVRAQATNGVPRSKAAPEARFP